VESLLFLAHRIPYPPNKGDKIRSFHFLKWMSGRYRVHLGAFVDDPADRRHVAAVERMCASVFLPPLNPRVARLRSLGGLFRQEALTETYYRSTAMQSWVDDTVRRHGIGRIFVYSSGVAHFALRHSSARRVMDFVDMDSDKWRQYGEAHGRLGGAIYRREAERLFDYERRIAREFDASIFVSPAEAAFFASRAQESAHRTHAIENGVDAVYFSPDASGVNPYRSGERAIVFTGAMDYHANVDAVEWFGQSVFPAVRAAQPAARFYIVGNRPAPAVRRLSGINGIHVTGAVPDVRPWLAHAHVAVAPLRIARGVQNKVLEAMAMERRVVMTPQAAEGIHQHDNLLRDVARDTNEYAEKVSRLLGGEPVRAIENREFVLRHYNWERNLERLGELLEDSVVGSPSSAGIAAWR
jgi:sugar transferase (PEP-CTERM/EpsH1 system associated)